MNKLFVFLTLATNTVLIHLGPNATFPTWADRNPAHEQFPETTQQVH
jgi:hypothetical protein